MEDLFNSEKPKKIPFKVPPDYFKELPMRINDRLERPTAYFSFWNNRAGVAYKLILSSIMFVFLISLGIWNFMPTDNTDYESILADVPQDTVHEYLESGTLYNEDILAMIDDDVLFYNNYFPDDFVIYEDDIDLEYLNATEELGF